MRQRRTTLAAMKYTVPLLIMTLLVACGDGKKEAAEGTEGISSGPAATWTLDLASEDLPLVVDLGDKTSLGVDSASVAWNEEFGRVEVHAGDHFSITIVEAPGDIARLKADLDRDMLRKHTVIEESPEKLVYRSQFPDEDLVFIHFRKVITVGDRTFVIEEASEGKFNEAEIARMAGAVKAKEAA